MQPSFRPISIARAQIAIGNGSEDESQDELKVLKPKPQPSTSTIPELVKPVPFLPQCPTEAIANPIAVPKAAVGDPDNGTSCDSGDSKCSRLSEFPCDGSAPGRGHKHRGIFSTPLPPQFQKLQDLANSKAGIEDVETRESTSSTSGIGTSQVEKHKSSVSMEESLGLRSESSGAFPSIRSVPEVDSLQQCHFESERLSSTNDLDSITAASSSLTLSSRGSTNAQSTSQKRRKPLKHIEESFSSKPVSQVEHTQPKQKSTGTPGHRDEGSYRSSEDSSSDLENDASNAESLTLDQEVDATNRIIPSSSSSSSSLSTEGTGEAAGERSKVRIRRSSSGKRLSRLRFDKRNSSNSNDTDNENPWFQNMSQDGEEESKGTGRETGRSKIKKLGRLGRVFRTQGKKGKTGMGRDISSSSSESLSLTASLSEGSSFQFRGDSALDIIQANLDSVLRRAISGRETIEKVLDAMLALTGRPTEKLLALLFKYLSSNGAIDSALRILLHDEFMIRNEIPLMGSFQEQLPATGYRDALVNTYINGSNRLKKALLYHTNAWSSFLRFFMEGRPEGERETHAWISRATCIAKLLNSLLLVSPSEFAESIGSKKGFLQALVRNHIHIPEVVVLVTQLCAANALAETKGDELRFGAANAAGIVLLSKESICDVLVEVFEQCCESVRKGWNNMILWQTQVMCTRCLGELSVRSIVIPRFSKTNCSYSGRYIKSLNSSLDDLNLFMSPGRAVRLIEGGLSAISEGMGLARSGSTKERNNPFVCVLDLVIELLGVVRRAAGSKSAVTRRTVGSTRTAALEREIILRMARLCKLLETKYAVDVSGRVRVGIVKTLQCLFDCPSEDTWFSLAKLRIPDVILMRLSESGNCSMMHRAAIDCMSAAFGRSEATVLHKAWLRALCENGSWLGQMTLFFTGTTRVAKGHELRHSTNMEFGFVLLDFSSREGEDKLQSGFQSGECYRSFDEMVAPGLRRIREEYNTPCGGSKPEGQMVSVLACAESLAARLNDVDAV